MNRFVMLMAISVSGALIFESSCAAVNNADVINLWHGSTSFKPNDGTWVLTFRHQGRYPVFIYAVDGRDHPAFTYSDMEDRPSLFLPEGKILSRAAIKALKDNCAVRGEEYRPIIEKLQLLEMRAMADAPTKTCCNLCPIS